HPLHILLIEDDKLNQKMATHFLEKEGHEVVAARNGKEALAAMDNYRFDIILMDVHMPEMDGYDATRHIRTRSKDKGGDVPIIALTAFAFKEDRDRCLEVGMDAFVTKPIDRKELFRVMAGMVGSPRTKDKLIFNRPKALDRADNDLELLHELASLFLKGYKEQMGMINTAIVADDGESLERTAHKLKTELASLAAESAHALVCRLEVLGRNNNCTEAMLLYEQLSKDIEQLELQLNALISEQSN
ncbi:MAG: response regulator, partial [Desulfobulbaceae bacterium]|nr:response regulator [Desulfobulbaceae bacterium]